jgi:hypothetical protein
MIEHQLEALQSEAWGVSGEEHTLEMARSKTSQTSCATSADMLRPLSAVGLSVCMGFRRGRR